MRNRTLTRSYVIWIKAITTSRNACHTWSTSSA
jgi:hypothetical protein